MCPMSADVAYLLSKEDIKRLVGIKGGGVAYDEIEVEGDLYARRKIVLIINIWYFAVQKRTCRALTNS
jgi:hypothetical protein